LLRLHDPAPGLASPAAVIAAALRRVKPAPRVSVSECAARHRRLNNPGAYVGPWKNEMTPHLVAPMNAVDDRGVSTIVFAGPPQLSAKSELILNVIGRAAKYRPADMLIFQPTGDLVDDFAKRRLREKCFAISPDLRDCIRDDRGADNVADKRFKNGSILAVRHPTGGELSSRPVPLIMFDERDSMPDKIGEEGDPVELGRNRAATFGKNGKVIVTSSLKRVGRSGIIVLYYEGTQKLWHWNCPHCGAWFAPGFDADRKPSFAHLRWRGWPSRQVAPTVAFETAFLVHPECGGVIEESQRYGLNLAGKWVALGQAVDEAGALAGEPPATRTDSYWFCGLASNLGAWGVLAHDLCKAEQNFEAQQDEEQLKAVWNRFGFPYEPKNVGVVSLDAETLRRRAEPYPLRIVPPGVRALFAAVDVQANRFDVLVRGFGERGESWIVDHFQLFKSADPDRMIQPASYAEDWDLLEAAVLDRTYPLAGAPLHLLPIETTALDTGGAEGVTQQAYDFWLRLRRRRAGVDTALMLVKGDKRLIGPPVLTKTIEVDARGRRLKQSVREANLSVGQLKDRSHAQLTRRHAGPGYVHLAKELRADAFDQLCAEKKAGVRWKNEGGRRNELWDLIVYTLAAWIRRGGDRINWSIPPAWAQDPFALAGIVVDTAGAPAAPDARAASGDGVRRPGPAAAMEAPPAGDGGDDEQVGATQGSVHAGAGAAIAPAPTLPGRPGAPRPAPEPIVRPLPVAAAGIIRRGVATRPRVLRNSYAASA
jgi:phage terminase large subunit GpA-like protein